MVELRCLLGAAAVAFGAHAVADVIEVPGHHPTIQEAIDAAGNGDTIEVAPDTYTERIDFLGKAITLRSTDGPEVTIIDGSVVSDSTCCVPETPGAGA